MKQHMLDNWVLDPEERKLLEEGPKSLAQAWHLLPILKYRYESRNPTEMWKTDSKLDDDLHDNDSIVIPQLHMKYMEFYNTYSLMKKDRELEIKRLLKEKWLYYKGRHLLLYIKRCHLISNLPLRKRSQCLSKQMKTCKNFNTR